MEPEPFLYKLERDSAQFSETWQRSQSWFQYEEITCAFFDKNKDNLQLKNATDFLSIGPGAGTIEKKMIASCMPQLKTFIAVEPTKELLEQLKINIGCIPQIKMQCHNVTLQDYQGPDRPTDIILLCHSIYYVADELEKHILRTMDWLAPEGTLIIAIGWEAENSFFNNMRKAFPWTTLGISSIHVKTALQTLQLKFEEYITELPTNIESPTGKEDFLAVTLNRKCTEEELNIMTDVLDKHWDPVTRDIGMKQSIFVVRKLENSSQK